MVTDQPVDQILASSSVMLVLGPGGVGKTTMAAALAVRAADRHQRRVLVVTVDPAKRLAEALGVDRLPPEPVPVPLAGSRDGRLCALMIDMSRSWDELVRRHGPGGDENEALLANPLYRSLTTRFIQSHDYIALDLMCDLAADDRYDLVVIDTPPATHALDVLDAPGRMVEFFDSRLLRWLIAPYGSRLARVTARPFLSLAERLLGQGFLSSIVEFFWHFAQLRPGLVARAAEVRRRLDDPETAYVLVTTAEPLALGASRALVGELVSRGHPPALIAHNRWLPPVQARTACASIHDPQLARAVASLLRHDQTLAGLATASSGRPLPVHPVAWRAGQVNTVADLRTLLD
jgi:anion-transporting  ArsA/GET3 family ATPase